MTPHADGHVISVVIPTVNRGSLDRTLEAMKAQTRPPDAVVVVEDTNRRGASWARNEGIRRAKGDLVAFTDDDCVPPPDWLERLIDAIKRHDAAGAGGMVHESDGLLFRRRLRRKYPDMECIDNEGWVRDTANLMVRRTWLDQCVACDGFVFDPMIRPCAEDIELMWRLRMRGATLVYVTVRVLHLRSVPFFKYISYQFGRGKGVAVLFLYHRYMDVPFAAQKSILWGERGGGRIVRWSRAVWKKVFGPFDVGSFQGVPEFITFWLGEKVEGAGFFWNLAIEWRRVKREITRRKTVLRDGGQG